MEFAFFEGTPLEIGRQYGRRFSNLILSYLNVVRLKGGLPVEPDLAVREMGEAQLREKAPWFLEELRGMAEGSGLTYEELLDLNLAGSQRRLPPARLGGPTAACSAFGAQGRATASGNPILGKLEDIPPWLYAYYHLRRVKPTNGYQHVGLSRTGKVGMMAGLNEKGVGIGIMSVGPCTDQGETLALPHLVMPGIVLWQCGSLPEAVDFMLSWKVANRGANFLVTDREGCAVVEMSRSHKAVRYPQDDLLIVVNRFEHPSMTYHDELGNTTFSSGEEWQRHNEARHARYVELLRHHYGQVDRPVAQAILSDHANGPDHSICTHHKNISSVIGCIIEPTENRIYFSDGFPCRTPFKVYSFDNGV